MSNYFLAVILRGIFYFYRLVDVYYRRDTTFPTVMIMHIAHLLGRATASATAAFNGF